jgi:hypothetical protein
MTVYSYDRCAEILAAQKKRGYDNKRLAGNTVLSEKDSCFAIDFYNTTIIKIHKDNTYELNADGFRTATTKERLNTFSPASIYQKRGVWFFNYNPIAENEDATFFDGAIVNSSGQLINRTDDSAELEKYKRLDRMINKYIRGFADDAIANGLKNPGGGDCLLCQMFSQASEISATLKDVDHVYSHLEEQYFVPSLLFWALKVKGYSNPSFIWAMIKLDCENQRDDMHKRELRYLFKKIRPQLVKFIEL